MRAFKKINTPFTRSKPTRAIIVVNAIDTQLNTIKCFIQACDDMYLPYIVFINKVDKIDNGHNEKWFKEYLDLKDIEWGSAKTGKGIKKLKTYMKLWKGERIIVLGVFNSGKTSIINKLCGTSYKVGDIPGTTLEFTETTVNEDTTIIDSVGQLIDIHKPLMVSIDYSDCTDRYGKIQKSFAEEILGIVKTKETIISEIDTVVGVIKKQLKEGNKIIVTGAGASALVAKEMAGQATECGIPIMCFTNDGAEIQPVTFSKGLGENEESISRYMSLAVNKGDVAIAVSASGGTGFTYDFLDKAKLKGAITIAITENSDTPITRNVDYILKSNAKPEGPSSSKIQTAHLVIGHIVILVLADELGITADKAVGYMLPEPLQNKKMGIK